MKTLTIRLADKEQEDVVVSFLKNLHIDFEEEMPDWSGVDYPAGINAADTSGETKKTTGDAWRFAT